MRIVVIYRDASEHGRDVESFLRDFERQTGHALEAVDPDSKEGLSLRETYDVVEYPSILALSDDGQMQTLWRGMPLPTISEVSFYA